MLKKLALTSLLLSVSISSHAGFNGLTYHSRANCGNNESISWDKSKYHQLFTISQHFRNGVFQHQYNTGWENTWRSAAVHWGEALPGSGWYVEGYHWIVLGGGQTLIAHTMVNDCSIYDGWWD